MRRESSRVPFLSFFLSFGYFAKFFLNTFDIRRSNFAQMQFNGDEI